jgi:hypothetical protein
MQVICVLTLQLGFIQLKILRRRHRQLPLLYQPTLLGSLVLSMPLGVCIEQLCSKRPQSFSSFIFFASVLPALAAVEILKR